MSWGKFPFYRQHDYTDCGHTCLRMIAKFYGKSVSLARLKAMSDVSFIGLSLHSLGKLAEKLQLRALPIQTDYKQLYEEVPLPCVVHWNQNHFVVVYKVEKNKAYIADPSYGKLKFSRKQFIKHWTGSEKENTVGNLLLLEPTLQFNEQTEDHEPYKPGIKAILQQLKGQQKFIVQLFLGLAAGSVLQLIFPLLTQAMVDIGISNRDVGFIYLILFAQLLLFVGRTTIDFIKNWIILHLGVRVNISIISDFLIKLMKLPLAFFETKHMGNLLQRITDHERIGTFFNSTLPDLMFGVTTLLIYSIIIAFYSLDIFAVFFVGSASYFAWIYIFLEKRKRLDYKKFSEDARNTSNLIELFTGMKEIKLNGAEVNRRWKWEGIQAKLYQVNIKSLSLKQTQEGGSLFINEVKNIVITFMAAQQVVNGEITLGMMLALSYIIGQLNNPILQAIGMIRNWQDARIALERISEIYDHQEEDPKEVVRTLTLPESPDIHIRNLSFKYEGDHNAYVLKELNMDIPFGKTTAIVGTSGSGKTTLLKLLLKFYPPSKGSIQVGGIDLENISTNEWRKYTGTVMQDGYIFSDTVSGNIVVNEDEVDLDRLRHAAKVANATEFIDQLPLGFDTMIGRDGSGLSVGQKQRILIARSIYRDPSFMLFDEATSALDANNEKTIMHQLNSFTKGRTTLVIAHRLSTVRNADQIVVLEQGKIIEQGTHQELTSLKGKYYHLVKNQLELGN
ncbi:peptidase domain-containing ABC transporter [uncultured Cyclobacterium sp.]|uniref:peptidase domain-containing ABC transporter n=1 Tax=uncultured Cyclobacterium sp. TaxID=453820 RepID=UPI0030EBFAD6|tara:strand:+ start:7204 stop:9399 length:2196 start_codon:yes stop_codon:yes gene_type:complete